MQTAYMLTMTSSWRDSACGMSVGDENQEHDDGQGQVPDLMTIEEA